MNDVSKRAPKRVGIMGGTFDPLHNGHLEVAEEALRGFDLDRVLFVPAGEPWQKERYSSAEDRYLMTVLGTEGRTDFSVSRVELDRRSATYTADTVNELAAFYGPDTRLYFIAGADAVLRMGTWRHLDRLVGAIEVIAVTRSGSDLSSLAPTPEWPELHVIEMPPVDVSASTIRELAGKGLSIEEMVPAAVAAYVRRQALYV